MIDYAPAYRTLRQRAARRQRRRVLVGQVAEAMFITACFVAMGLAARWALLNLGGF